MFSPRLRYLHKCNLAKLPLKASYQARAQVSQAVVYERFSETQRQEGVKLIKKLKIMPGTTALDLGCGTGSLAKVLSIQVGAEGKVIAVDPDKDRLKIARRKYSARNIDYVEADDKSFPFAAYNLVFCNATIHWIRDKEGLYRRVHETLQPGGRFTFTTPDTYLPIPDIGRKLFDKLLGTNFLHRMHTQVKSYRSADEYKRMAEVTGFKVISAINEDVEIYWTDLDHYIDSMHGWFGGEFDPSQLNEKLLQELREEHGCNPIVLPEPIKKLEFIFMK